MPNGSTSPLRDRLPKDPDDRAYALANEIDSVIYKLDRVEGKVDALDRRLDDIDKRNLNRFIAILSSVSVAIVLLLVDIITRGAGG